MKCRNELPTSNLPQKIINHQSEGSWKIFAVASPVAAKMAVALQGH